MKIYTCTGFAFCHRLWRLNANNSKVNHSVNPIVPKLVWGDPGSLATEAIGITRSITSEQTEEDNT